MSAVPIIELRNAGARRGDYEILRDVSFALPENSVAFFMGVAGSGKSALLKTAAGLRPADSGEVLFRGISLSRMSRREEAQFRRVSAFVFQDAALWANQSLFDNLALPARVHDPTQSKAELERVVRRAVELVGYEEDLRSRPSDLSSGERRIVGLARALVLDPELLFMDEPFANLDESAVERVSGIIGALKKRGRSIAIVTGQSDFVSTHADYVAVLGGGGLRAFGTYEEAVGWTDPSIRAVTGRLRARRAGSAAPAVWGLAGAWAEALAEDKAVLDSESGAADRSAPTGTAETLGDLINALPIEEDDEERGAAPENGGNGA